MRTVKRPQTTDHQLPTAVFIGRFQPFHIGHFDALSRMRSEIGRVKILVGSSNRSRTVENPMTFTERRAYIRSIVGGECPILPLPDHPSDAVWLTRLRKRIGTTDVVYSGNEWVLRICREAGIACHAITYHEDISATRIRDMIARGDDKYAQFLVNKRLPRRILEVLKG